MLTVEKVASLISPRRWPFWVVVLLLVYTLGGFFGLPWLLQKQGVDRMAALNRTLTIEKVRVNPFTFVIEVQGLDLLDDDQTRLVSWDRYLWNFELSSLFNWAWTFKEIRLEGFFLNMERFSPGDQRFGRFMDAFPSEEEPQAAAEEEAGIPRLIIGTLAVTDARLGWTDHLTEPVFSTVLGPISAEVQNLSTLPDDTGQQRVQISNQSGGSLSWSGSVEISPFHSSGEFEISGRAFDDLFDYLDRVLPFKSEMGEATIDFNYEVSMDAENNLALTVSEGRAEFSDFKIHQPDVPEAVIDIPSIKASGAGLKWPEQAVSANEVTIAGLNVDAWMDADGEINLMSLIPQPGDAETSPASEPAKPWSAELKAFGLEQATINVQDRSLQAAPTFTLNELMVKLGDINLEEGSLFPLSVDTRLASGGSLGFEGEVGVFPDISATGQMNLQAFTLSALQDYVAEVLRVEIQSGSLDLQGQVTTNTDELMAYSGTVQLNDLNIQDTVLQEKLLGLVGMDIDRADISLSENSASLSVIELDQPSARVHIAEDLTTNVGDLVIASDETEAGDGAAVETEEAAAFQVSVDGIEFEQGALDFSDFSLPLPFEANITSLEGSVSALSSESTEPAVVNLEGQVNEFGQARIDGSISAWAPTDNTDIAMIFRNLEMARLTPYTVQFAGHTIAEGRMDLDLNYKLQSKQLEGANSIVIRELTLGEKVDNPDAASLPLGLAVALLKDSEGVIDIDLPVSGNLDDPEFSYGSVVAKALFNLITKIVTSPFRLLGNLVGIDSEDFGTLEFQPGEFDVSPPDREKLVKLQEAMVLRPELLLEVRGVYDAALDREALKQIRVQQRIAELEQPGDELSRQVIESLFTGAFPDADLAALQLEFTPVADEASDAKPELDQLAYVNELKRRLVENETVTDEQLGDLAQQRSQAVMAVLTEGQETPPENIRIAGAEAIDASDNALVLMELQVSIEE